MKARIVITKHEMIISILPIYKKSIILESITYIKQIGIKPIQEFGGWGIRWNGKKQGLIMQGDEGVEIGISNGKSLVISSRNAEKIYNALNENWKLNRHSKK
ncbi:hypothetical protein GCM10010916_33360 [Paenibacillus abyssi]|uniref:Uncharacterized protein n=2 Tax=Paenibacillus abyssi TaxID=1340531 RepID=A0A917FY46_9BACL|nr:hypothetical protein GCM10010916_33360 [Paenibacillus abyssi]